METIPSLAELIAPTRVSDFLRDHFEGSPLHVSAAGARDRFASLYSSAELLRLARTRPLPTLSVTPADEDGRIFAAIGRRPVMRIDASGIDCALASGATLMVDELEKLDARVARLAARVKRDLAFGGSVGVVAFLSPPGRGVPTHIDNGSTFIFHLEGRKTWRLSKSPRMTWSRVLARQLPGGTTTFESTRGALPDLDPAEQALDPLVPENTMEVTLEPGDVLYVPPGAWHGTTADDSPTFSINVHIHPFHPGEVLLEALKPALGHGLAWRRIPAHDGAPGEGMPPAIRRYFEDRRADLRRAVESLSEEHVERQWKKLLAEAPEGPEGVRALAPVSPRDRVALTRSAPVTFQIARDERGGARRVQMYRGDREVDFDDPELVPIAERVVRGEPFVATDATAWGGGSSWERVAGVLDALLGEGMIERAP